MRTSIKQVPVNGYIQGQIQFNEPATQQPVRRHTTQQSSALDLIKNMTQTSRDQFMSGRWGKEIDTVKEWIERYSDVYEMWSQGYTCAQIKRAKEANGQKISNNTIYNVRRLALNVKAYYAAGYSYEQIMQMDAAQLYDETPQLN